MSGIVSSLGEGEISKVICGTYGAYVILVNKSTEAAITEDSNFDIELAELNSKASSKLDYVIRELVLEKAEIEDKRYVIK